MNDMDFKLKPQVKKFFTEIEISPEIRDMVFRSIEDAFIEGYHQGFHKGYEDGHLNGYSSGYEEGHESGFFEGFDEAERCQQK